MFLFRKYYDAAVADAGGGVAETAVAENKTPTFAEAMAQSGARTSSTDNPAARPVVNKTENKEEPKTAEAKSENAETATTTSNEAERAKPESLTPEKETEKVAETQKEPATQTLPSWQEVLKSQQPDNVLKELGFDDKTVKVLNKLKGFEKIDFFDNLVEVWKNKGDLKGYIKEMNTDYGKMTPEEVMRHQLSEEYGTDDPKTLDALFKNKVIKAYNLDSDDSDEVEEGKLLLNAEANKYRPALIERQKEKLFPDVPEAKAEVVDNSAADRQKQEFEAYMSTVNKDPYAEKVFEKNQIVLGKGEDKFIFPIDSNEIKNILYNQDKWTETQFDKITNPDGSFKYIPKVENQILTAAFAKNPQKFLEDYAKHFLSLGGKKAIEPLDNAKPPENKTVSNATIQPANLVEGMAQGGRKVSGVM